MMKQLINSLLIILPLLYACGSHSEFRNSVTADYNKAEIQKFSKYMIQGRELYVSYCSNCHQTDGIGLGKLIPALVKVDYMKDNENRTICIIKNGLQGEIKVNGIAYHQPMPAFKQLSNLEIAEISTYIYNSWGNETGIIDIEAVEQALDACAAIDYEFK